jgi:hypothetical protein
MTLPSVTRFEFSRLAIEQAHEFLRSVGEEEFEAVALFGGLIDGAVARITTTITPVQKTYKTEYGLMYRVEGMELHRINKWLHENKLLLLAQIHSHPTEAYHSEMDDEYTIVSTVGGLSIVVPDFAQKRLNHHQWAYYRLDKKGQWRELGEQEIDNLIKIV